MLIDADLYIILLGLLLCAKTKVAKVRLTSYFAEGAINAAKKRCKNLSLILEDIFSSIHIMYAVQVIEMIYRDKSEFSEERKISKFYRALVTGILDDDEVLSLI